MRTDVADQTRASKEVADSGRLQHFSNGLQEFSRHLLALAASGFTLAEEDLTRQGHRGGPCPRGACAGRQAARQRVQVGRDPHYGQRVRSIRAGNDL